MFTGIVTAVGRIDRRESRAGGLVLAIAAPELATDDRVLGESIAVAGVCLTVTGFDAAGFTVEVSGETLRRTTLGRCRECDAINLERALRAGDRLGGHLVSGHVDGVGRVREIADDALSRVYGFEAPAPLLRYLAVKGSVAVDGVSLTVNAVAATGFGVNLIPHTLAHTTLGSLVPGAEVNIEIDTVARYVERLLSFGERGSLDGPT